MKTTKPLFDYTNREVEPEKRLCTAHCNLLLRASICGKTGFSIEIGEPCVSKTKPNQLERG